MSELDTKEFYDNQMDAEGIVLSKDQIPDSSPVPAPEDTVNAIIQRVCELEYTPPEDFPEDMVMCTTAELRLIVEDSQVERMEAEMLTEVEVQLFIGLLCEFESTEQIYAPLIEKLRRLSSGDSE